MQYRSYSQGCAAQLGKYPGILAEVVQGGVCSLLALKGEGSVLKMRGHSAIIS